MLRLAIGLALWLAAGGAGAAVAEPASTPPSIHATAANAAVADPDLATLSPVVDNPYVALASRKSAVYEGKERDPDTGKMVRIRMESTVREAPETIAGAKVTVVEVVEYEGKEVTEKTWDYFAQDASGVVYYIGEKVDEYEEGKVVSHGGQWLASDEGSRPGLFMPATPGQGDAFEQERTPGVAEDHSIVLKAGQKVVVPAGTFEDCIEVEDYDPVGKKKQIKTYCRGVGLVREVFDSGGSLELVKILKR